MAEVEWEHEHYFRACVMRHRWAKRFSIWPEPPPKETIRGSMNKILPLLVLLLLPLSLSAQTPNKKLAAEVKAEFLHAWNGYKKYAWGHDDLKPLSKTYHDWYPQPLLMTPVDSLDTMIIMEMDDEVGTTKQYILENLSFDKDIEVQNFEITIRLLGGLLTNYQLTGDKRFLDLAEDLGNRLLPVFESPTGLPYRYVNLKTGKVSKPVSNPAETGTLIIEFGTLSKLTGKPIFYDKAKRALVETYNRRSKIGLVGEWIDVEKGTWTNTDSHISGAIDSYYEYLLKCSLLFGDPDCKRMWNDSISAINKYLADEFDGELWYGHADMNTGARRATTYGALDAFFPTVLALSGDLKRAERLQDSSFRMWNHAGIEPEEFDYRARKIVSPGYPLRPEIVESTYYLYRYTKDRKYLLMGEKLWRDFVKHCRTEDGYAALKSVVTKEKNDSMQSFLFAETFKYFYLLFSPPSAFDFDKVIFNTEAHPIRRTW
jgi:mannosidase alpha-like ER degradation enhancer 2